MDTQEASFCPLPSQDQRASTVQFVNAIPDRSARESVRRHSSPIRALRSSGFVREVWTDGTHHDPRPPEQDVQRDPALGAAGQLRRRRPAGGSEGDSRRRPREAAPRARPRADDVRARLQQQRPALQAEDPVRPVRGAAAAARLRRQEEREGEKPRQAGEQRIRHPPLPHPARRRPGALAAGRRRRRPGPGRLQEAQQGRDAAARRRVHQVAAADDRGPRARDDRRPGRLAPTAPPAPPPRGEQVLLDRQPGALPGVPADADVLGGVSVADALAQLGGLVLDVAGVHERALPPHGKLRELRPQESRGRGAARRDILLAAGVGRPSDIRSDLVWASGRF